MKVLILKYKCDCCGKPMKPRSNYDGEKKFCSYECGKDAQPQYVKMTQAGHRQ